MFRDFLTNKWIIGGVAFLILFAVACVFWYRYDTAPDRRDAAETAELLRQWAAKKAEPDDKVEQAADASVKSTTPTAEKSITETTSEVTEDTTSIQIQKETKTAYTNIEVAEEFVSPFGFGPYPKVPDDYFGLPIWMRDPLTIDDFPDHARRNIELIDRVLVKLWIQGDHAIVGGSTYNGKIYPHYLDVVYVGYKEKVTENGVSYRFISNVKAPPNIRLDPVQIMEGNIPPHYKIIDLDEAGIDPYEFLKLGEPEY